MSSALCLFCCHSLHEGVFAGPQGIAIDLLALSRVLAPLFLFHHRCLSPHFTSKGPVHGLGWAHLYLRLLGADLPVVLRQLTSTRFHQLLDSHCPTDSLRKTYCQISALEHSSSFCKLSSAKIYRDLQRELLTVFFCS